jgi:ribosomal protein L11 methyltransferase
MSWLQLTLTTDRERAALIEAALEGAGALAVTLGDAGDEPQLEPAPGATPLWSQVLVTALFEDDAESRTRAHALTGSLAAQLVAPPRFERLENRPWERAWMDDFVPSRFGKRLWVCPRGQAPEAEDAVVVELDPGLAFGTGRHPTTALCLRWLDAGNLTGATLVDYGCGSGILAIAALKLGVSRAIAVDHDPQALDATLVNAEENGVADRLQVCSPSEVSGCVADMLVANILAGPLVDLAPILTAMVAPGGRLALSGLLLDQIETVSKAYLPRFSLGRPKVRDEWVLLSGRRMVGD